MKEKKRIMIVEDEGVTAMRIQGGLEKIGYVITSTFVTAEEAIIAVAADKPDLVLMDIALAGEMDGITAAKKIHNQYKTPIVYITAHLDEETIKRAKITEPFGYIVKPFETRELAIIVEIALYKYEMEEEREKLVKELQMEIAERHKTEKALQSSEKNLQNIFNSSIPICITGTDYQILLSNDAYKNIFNLNEHSRPSIKCYDSRPGPACDTDACPMKKVLSGEKEVVYEPVKECEIGSKQYFIVTARPFLNDKGEIDGIVESFQDITDRKNAEIERDNLIKELQRAISEIKTLRGILPICSFCKNIRNDEGYYEQIEGYIHKHSGVDFSHTICPKCMKENYPEEYASIEKKNDDSST